MKLRLSLTLSITRHRTEPEGVEPPHIFESQGSLVDLAAPHPIGFTREPQLEPDDGNARGVVVE